MRTDFFKISRKSYVLIIPFLLGITSCTSCESTHITEKNAEHVHKEGKGHDHDGEGHGPETKGHDKDEQKHDETNGEHGERGEEDGTQYAKTDTYKVNKHGVLLQLQYDATQNAFIGSATNTSEELAEAVRVEVHLSNGTELGPTQRTDLKPGQKIDIHIPAGDQSFETWNTHAEVGNNEHGHEGSEGHREGREHRNEHR